MSEAPTIRQRKRGDYYPDTMSRDARRLYDARRDFEFYDSFSDASEVGLHPAFQSLRAMALDLLQERAAQIIAGPKQ